MPSDPLAIVVLAIILLLLATIVSGAIWIAARRASGKNSRFGDAAGDLLDMVGTTERLTCAQLPLPR